MNTLLYTTPKNEYEKAFNNRIKQEYETDQIKNINTGIMALNSLYQDQNPDKQKENAEVYTIILHHLK